MFTCNTLISKRCERLYLSSTFGATYVPCLAPCIRQQHIELRTGQPDVAKISIATKLSIMRGIFFLVAIQCPTTFKISSGAAKLKRLFILFMRQTSPPSEL
jgi:hypothetical protein